MYSFTCIYCKKNTFKSTSKLPIQEARKIKETQRKQKEIIIKNGNQ